MKNKTLLLVSVFLLLVFLLGLFFYFNYKYNSDLDSKKYCSSVEDCVPASCCHSEDVINKKFAPDCSNVFCTEVCSGPLDCNLGRIECVKNICTILKN